MTATAIVLETSTTQRRGVLRKVAVMVLWRYSLVMSSTPRASGKSVVKFWTSPAL